MDVNDWKERKRERQAKNKGREETEEGPRGRRAEIRMQIDAVTHDATARRESHA